MPSRNGSSGQLLEGLEPRALKDLVVAYEPVLGYRDGTAASPDDAAAAAALVRQVVEKVLGSEAAAASGHNTAAASTPAISAALPPSHRSTEPWSAEPAWRLIHLPP